MTPRNDHDINNLGLELCSDELAIEQIFLFIIKNNNTNKLMKATNQTNTVTSLPTIEMPNFL